MESNVTMANLGDTSYMASGRMGAFDDTFLLATSSLLPRSLRAHWLLLPRLYSLLDDMSAQAQERTGLGGSLEQKLAASRQPFLRFEANLSVVTLSDVCR